MFAEKCVDQVSVEELIEEVGISRRTFYGFFANKYEIVASVLNPLLESGVDELADLSEGSAEDVIPGIIDFYLRQWAGRRDALLIIGSVDRDILPYIKKSYAAFGKAMRSLLKRAERAGALRNDRADCTFKVIIQSTPFTMKK